MSMKQFIIQKRRPAIAKFNVWVAKQGCVEKDTKRMEHVMNGWQRAGPFPRVKPCRKVASRRPDACQNGRG